MAKMVAVLLILVNRPQMLVSVRELIVGLLIIAAVTAVAWYGLRGDE